MIWILCTASFFVPHLVATLFTPCQAREAKLRGCRFGNYGGGPQPHCSGNHVISAPHPQHRRRPHCHGKSFRRLVPGPLSLALTRLLENRKFCETVTARTGKRMGGTVYLGRLSSPGWKAPRIHGYRHGEREPHLTGCSCIDVSVEGMGS